MNRRLLPKVNFKAYRRPQFLYACYAEWGKEYLGWKARYARGCCPLCQPTKEKGRSFSWSFEKASFYCHSCKKRGDALELVMLMTGCDLMSAAKWLEQRGGPSGSGLVVPES